MQSKIGKMFAQKLHIRNTLVRVALAEFFGTFILIVFGDGSVAQSVLSKTAKGTFISVNWCWCMAVMAGAYSCIGVSGGHINPAVSLAMAMIGRLSWLKLPVYMLAQYLGAFTGAATVYMVYYDAIHTFENNGKIMKENFAINPTLTMDTAGIFSTYPQDFLTTRGGLIDQIVGTAMLVIVVMIVSDPRNSNTPKYLAPVIVGMTVFVIGAAYGLNCGYAINPARDLGPRILTSIAGWGIKVFRNYNWFWIPIIGPHIGAIIGAFLYLLFIELHWEQADDVNVQISRKEEGHKNEAMGESKPASESLQIQEKRLQAVRVTKL